MNHKINGDVTAGYIIADVEGLRKSMQQITDYLLKCMKIIQPADITVIQEFQKGLINEQTA